jgi:4-hydroxyphenylpyruvate dioxygenase-like putative hemolysin
MSASSNRITRIHHIGVTVNDAQKAVEAWREAFGIEGKVVDDPAHDLKIGVVEVGGVRFLLNERTDPGRKAAQSAHLDLPVEFSGHRIVNSVGEGISHIALETTDLAVTLDGVRKAGMHVLNDEPKDALEGICSFVAPEDARFPLEFMQAVEGREDPFA